MKLVYISSASPEATLIRYGKKYKDQNQKNIQQRWDLTLAIELEKICKDNMICISYPPVATFPSSKCILFNMKQADTVGDLAIWYTRCCNLPIVKQLMEVRAIEKHVRDSCFDRDEKIILLSTSINLQSYKAYKILKKKYKNIKIVSVVPDLPDHMVTSVFTGHLLLKKFLNIYKNKTVKIEKYYDGYICFTKQQLKFLNDKVPFMIMEGFVDRDLVNTIAPKAFQKKVITYAGGITKRYGILELVNGFIDAQLPGVELHLYGSGDCVQDVLNLQEKNIFYNGLVPREEAIAVEKGSYLLVNPRPIDDEYSWCSFPSKIMEYLSTGTPVVSSKLICFTEEWLPMMTFFNEVSVPSISKTLTECVKEYDALKEKSENARKFVNEQKNCASQAHRIWSFLENELYAE